MTDSIGTAVRPTDRITARVRTVTGRARTCLPARTASSGGERWRYPEGEDPVIVRGED